MENLLDVDPEELLDPAILLAGQPGWYLWRLDARGQWQLAGVSTERWRLASEISPVEGAWWLQPVSESGVPRDGAPG